MNPDIAGSPEEVEAARLLRLQEYLAQDRRKKNAADSEKLLTLAAELNTQFGRPNPAPPTLSEVNKVKEIEKLAKRVKQRMSQQ